MDDAARSLLELWDVTGTTVDGLAPSDWQQPLAAPGMDVLDLVTHLTGVHYGGPDRLREAVGAARERIAAQVDDRVAGDRLLAAWCLDMCLHTHDLGLAVGRPVDLADHPAATREACRLVVGFVPRLLVAALGARDCTLRLHVPGQRGLDRVVHVADGRPAPTPPDAEASDVVEVDAPALLLLLSGRRPVDTLRDEGAVRWWGEAADAFVHGARLLSA